MRVIILGEGNDELGPSWQTRRPYEKVLTGFGSLEIIVTRLAKLVVRLNLEIIHFPCPPRSQLIQVLQDPNLLRRALQPCYNSAAVSAALTTAEAGIIVCDEGKSTPVGRAVAQIRLNFPGRLVHACLQPMLEAALAEKCAMEKATGIRPCNVRADVAAYVANSADPKQAFRTCLVEAGRSAPPHSGVKAAIAGALSERFLCQSAALETLRTALNSLQ